MIPARTARTNNLREPVFGKFGNVADVRVIAVIPAEHYHVLGEGRQYLRVIKSYVSPHHNRLSAGSYVINKLCGEFQIKGSFVLSFVASRTQIEGLVTAYIEVFASEKRDILIDYRRYKLKALGVRGIYSVMQHTVYPEIGVRLIILKLTQMLVLGAVKQMIQMPEGRKRRYEIYKMFVTVVVELHNLLCRHISVGSQEYAVLPKIVSVLYIELQSVYFVK